MLKKSNLQFRSSTPDAIKIKDIEQAKEKSRECRRFLSPVLAKRYVTSKIKLG